MKVAEEALAIIDESRLEGRLLYLPERQLERPLYNKVKKALELAGGKWERGSKAFVFADPAEEALEPIFLTGQITDKKSEFGAFFTPAQIVNRVLQAAELQPEHSVLEPSAGHGNIAFRAAEFARNVVAMDVLPAHVEYLRQNAPANVTVQDPFDFLAVIPKEGSLFDRVLMNPPFAKMADARHVLHALRFLKEGGRLVAIMAASIKYRKTGPYKDLSAIIEERGGTIEDLPEGSFASEGTQVNTVLVVIDG